MKTLRLARTSYFLLCLVAALLLWAMAPAFVSAKTFNVRVSDEVFEPDNITVEVGDTVIWTSKSSNAHTMEMGDDEGHTCLEDINHTFASSGDTKSHTFTIAESCYYTCRLHGSGMNGVVHVKPKSGTTTTTIQEK